jgi:hypothetical protein
VWLQLRTWNITWTFPAPLEARIFAAFANEKSKLAEITGHRTGPLDGRAKSVIALMEKCGSKIESFDASHLGYATMAGPSSLQFAEKCWAHLNPNRVKKIAFSETIKNPEVVLRLFRNGCPRLEKLKLSASADSVPGLADLLLKAEFPRLRVVKEGSRYGESGYRSFVRKISDQLERFQCHVSPDPAWEEVTTGPMKERLESRNPLDLDALNSVTKKIIGVTIEKVQSESSNSLLGSYIYRSLALHKSVIDQPEVLEGFNEFFTQNFTKQYPCQNSIAALRTLAGLIVRAQGADKSFVAAIIEWVIPFALDHKFFKHEQTIWAMLYHASAFHAIDGLDEKCFAPLRALIEASPKTVSLFEFTSHPYTFNRFLKEPADWIRRNMLIDQPGQFGKVSLLVSNVPQSANRYLSHEVFDPNLSCNKLKGRTILHVLLVTSQIDTLAQVGLAMLKRINNFDPKTVKLNRLDQFYMVRRIFENDDLISLYRAIVADWRLMINLDTLKEIPNGKMGLKIMNFIDSYPTKLAEEQRTGIFHTIWKNAILKSYNEAQLDSHLQQVKDCFPGREIPQFIIEALVPAPKVKIGTVSAQLPFEVIEKMMRKHFPPTEKQAESCNVS